jgi:BASS family bile acid:Na+ symporter
MGIRGRRRVVSARLVSGADRAAAARTSSRVKQAAVNTDRLINILAAVALVELMLTIGLGAKVNEVLAVARDWRGLVRAGIANYVLVPAATVGLLLTFTDQPMVAAGFIVVAVCPGAPFGPPFTAIAKGDVSRAIGLMVLLAGSSALLAPLLLRFLLPMVTGAGPSAGIDALHVVRTLAFVQFLPLCVGLAVSAYRPGWAQRWKGPAGRLSTILNLALLGLVIVVQFRMLSAIRVKGYVGMFLLWAISAGVGWALGGRVASERGALAITTAVRNVGVALVIAGGNFPGTPAVTATIAYGLFQTLATLAVVLAIARSGAAKVIQSEITPVAIVPQHT